MSESPVRRVPGRRSVCAVAWRAGSVVCCVLAALVALGGGVSSGNGDAAVRGAGAFAQVGEVRVLAPGEVVQRRMEAGAKHGYELALAEGQFARVFVEQRGVDVGVKVSAPGGSLLADIDSPNGFYGLEAVSVKAQAAGSYLVEVYSYSLYPPGDYELRVEGPRAASASDEKRVMAERVFMEAQALRDEARKLQREAAAEKYAAAIRKYEEAHGIWLELGELRGQGYSLSAIGRSYKAQGQLAPALDHLGRSLARLREAGDASGQAFVLNETGAAHRDLGDLREAVASYESALPLRIKLGDRWGQAQLYNNLGFGYSLIGYQPKALENYEKSLPLWRALGMRHWEMNTLVNAGKARVEMGDLDAALAQYQEVLAYCDAELARNNSPLRDSATGLKPYALNGIGLVHDTWADADAALRHYRQSLELFRVNKNARGEADVLDNLGMAHAFLGDATQALEYFREALALREQLNEPKGWGITLSNIGYAHTLLGDNEEALRQLARALPQSERSRDRRFEAYTLFRMGMAHVALNDPRGALEKYQRALAIQQEKDFADRRGQAMTLDKIGEALALAGEPMQALARYGQALEMWKSVGDGQGQALSLYGMAHVERDRSNLANARDQIEEALRIIESLRNRVTARQLQMIYFAGKQDFYALAIDVRMRLYELTKSHGEVEAALAASERARVRALVDLLSEARAGTHKKLSPEEAEKNHRLGREISELTQTLLRLRSQGAKAGIAVVEQKVAARIKEQDDLLGTTRRSVAGARPLPPREIQRLLDDDTLLLHYSLGEARSHLWTVTQTDIKHHFLPGRAEVEKIADQLRRALIAHEPLKPGESATQYLSRLRSAPEQYRRSASELSRMVLGEVWPQLGHKRLVVVADGALHYIPFEALPAPALPAAEQTATDPAPLLRRNEVVYQPSASTLALLRGARRRVASKTVAVFADPVFDDKDERVRASAAGRRAASASPPRQPSDELARALRDVGDVGDEALTLPKLEYSLREANAITSVAPRGSWMKAVDFQASRATATSPVLKQFSIVHFATHGLLNEKHPELSGIVLSMVNERGQPEDGFLSLRDIYQLDLPVDLVVLSACQTGLGKPVRGEGLVGLTRGFMYAGAPRVVASLWRVDDAATAELMTRFYRHMLGRKRLPAAAALRRAKIEMLEAHGNWRAPYFWAGLVLQGDWK